MVICPRRPHNHSRRRHHRRWHRRPPRPGDRAPSPLVPKNMWTILSPSKRKRLPTRSFCFWSARKLLPRGAGAASVAALLNNKLPAQKQESRRARLRRQHRRHPALTHHRTRPGERRPSVVHACAFTCQTIPALFTALTGILAELRANIVETAYDRAYHGVNLGDTAIDITMETRGPHPYRRAVGSLVSGWLRPRNNPIKPPAQARWLLSFLLRTPAEFLRDLCRLNALNYIASEANAIPSPLLEPRIHAIRNLNWTPPLLAFIVCGLGRGL